ncbi:MAG: DUF885 family protein [Flavobacteriales bacterium]|nr:DUF885 family protein [Flavobacteriales bacterium]
MRKATFILLILGSALLLFFGIWFAKLVWFKPINIDHFFERVYIEFLWDDPEALTQTGVLKPFWISGYKSELTDISPKATERLAEVGRKNLNLLEEYDRSKLNESQKVSYDVLHWFLKTGVAAEPFLFHDYPITHISGAHIEVPQFMNSLPLQSRNDIENYLSRLEKIDEKFGSVIDALEERKKRGIVPPTHILKEAILFCDHFYQTPVEENVLFTSFQKKLNAIGLLEPTKRDRYIAQCRETIQGEVIPAYRRLSQYLLQLERSSLNIAGVWQLPNGDAYYRSCLLQQTTLKLDPDSLYEWGKTEMERLNAELSKLQVFTKGAVVDSFRTDSLGRLQTIQYFSEVSDAMKPLLPSYFNRLPSTELEILELPAYRANNSTFAFYIPPRGEPRRNGKVYVNTWKAEQFPKYLAKTFAYHEGIPGHHIQKGIQADLTELPTFRRFIPFSAYTEGWGMYAEQLGHEMTGTLDAFDQMGQVQSELFRTARMMADIGIHHKKWLREQAITFMMENASLSESEAADEVDRYIVWPGQGCAYKVGLMKFRELRQRAESQISDFDIKEFHGVLLNEGAMPLEILEQRVDAYISSKQDKSKPSASP